MVSVDSSSLPLDSLCLVFGKILLIFFFFTFSFSPEHPNKEYVSMNGNYMDSSGRVRGVKVTV